MAAPKIPDAIRSYLINTTGITDTVSLYALQPTPITQYAVVEYPGTQSTRVHGSSTPGGDVALDESLIQIQSRHATVQTARNNLHTVYDALDGLSDVTINSVVYTYMQAISRPRLLDYEENGSAIFIFELRVQARR